jgi:hypothetical protein
MIAALSPIGRGYGAVLALTADLDPPDRALARLRFRLLASRLLRESLATEEIIASAAGGAR